MTFLSQTVDIYYDHNMIAQTLKLDMRPLGFEFTSWWQFAKVIIFMFSVNNLASGCFNRMVGHLQ